MSAQPELEPDMLDPDTSNYLAIFGRKGSGKSVRARSIFEDWPNPRMVIDVLGTVAPVGPDGVPVRPIRVVPERWPTMDVDGRTVLVPVLWYVPDMGSPSWVEEVDSAIGLCYRTGGVLLWLDEVHLLLPVTGSKSMPAARRALIAGRHEGLSLLSCGPRPRDIDRLVLLQADHVLVYSLPLRDDREAIADAVGWDRQDFHHRHNQLAPYEYLWANVAEARLTHYDPVPQRRPRPARP